MKCSHCGEIELTTAYTLMGGVHTDLCLACVTEWDRLIEIERRATLDRVRAKALAFCDPAAVEVVLEPAKPSNQDVLDEYEKRWHHPKYPQFDTKAAPDAAEEKHV